MEFVVRKSQILHGVSFIQGVVETKTTMPILANLSLETTEEQVHFAATDLDLAIKSYCSATVRSEGAITVPARRFLEILRVLPDEDITVKTLEKNWVQIRCASSFFKIAGLPIEDFPTLPELGDAMVEVRANDLFNLINRTIFSVSQADTRIAMKGALLLIKPLSVTMVATDGHRLSYVEKPDNFDHLSAEIQTVIPRKALLLLQRLLPELGEADAVRFGKDDNHLYFRFGNCVMISRMMTEEFPNYEAVLPKSNMSSVTVDRQEFAAAIKRVSLLADDKSRSIRIVLKDNKLMISSSHADLGEAKDEIATPYSDEEVRIGFNCQYLLDFLSATADPSINFDFKDDASAGQFRPATEEDYRYLYVVMPMRN